MDQEKILISSSDRKMGFDILGSAQGKKKEIVVH